MTTTEVTGLWPQNEELSPWLDRSDAPAQIEIRQARGEFDAETARKLRQWHEQGYLVLPGLLEPELLDHVLEAFEDCYRTGKELAVDGYLQPLKRDTHGHLSTVTGAALELTEVRDIFLHRKILEWSKLLLDSDVFGAHTVFFFTGSEQPVHHDHVHETNRPFGWSVGVAIAFEDIQPGSGELIYYPGSHRLGYINASRVASQAGVDNSQKLIDQAVLSSMQGKQIHSADFFKEYGITCNLPVSQIWSKKIEAAGLKPESFLASKGDVIIWHANLAHAGSAIRDARLSRKSMVAKYVAKDVDFYHEIAPDYLSDISRLAYHNGYPYLVERRVPLPEKNLLEGARDLKDLEIARLKSELAALQQWAEETKVQSQQAFASLTEHLELKEQELQKAQSWIAEKEADSIRVAAAYEAHLKAKEAELGVLQEMLKNK
jgi:ectoine hydroxylase-related dioxygenase (phytanoyl-CoA dioxygenase family)